MKIAINASILDDIPSGLGTYTLNIINELCKIIDKEDELIIYTSCPNYFKEQFNIKIKSISAKTQPKYGKNAAIKRFLWTQLCLIRDIKRENIDILYSPTQHGVLFPYNQIVTIHDLLPIHFNYKNSLQRILQSSYYKYILPKVLNKSRIITVSDNTMNDIINYYNINKERVIRIYNGYNSEQFYVRKEANKYIYKKYGIINYILGVGASYPYKNYDNALKAFSLLKNEIINDMMFVIVGGRTDYQNQLKMLSHNLGISQNILFIDYVPQAELPYLYSAAKSFLYPSLYEGFGLPVLEAMACGCPVITSKTSSLPEVGGNAVYYVDPYNIEDIANGILKLLKNEELRNKLIISGLKRVENFTWRKTAEQILKVLKND
jgi:glycosyltransferase involved in cell wall biosynthesis